MATQFLPTKAISALPLELVNYKTSTSTQNSIISKNPILKFIYLFIFETHGQFPLMGNSKKNLKGNKPWRTLLTLSIQFGLQVNELCLQKQGRQWHCFESFLE